MNLILIPLAVTVICFAIAAFATHGTGQRNVGDFSSALDAVIYYGGALFLSLIAWLGWAIVT